MEYERAVQKLNELQTRPGEKRPCDDQQGKMDLSLQYLERSGVTSQDLNQLSAIHVAGTKGKGSVCAMCESVLRAHGIKTGFYSSPHLLEVRERIRIDGRPLSKIKFASYFWRVFDKLNNSKHSYKMLMPGYFGFLTVMAFNVFLKEKVDVAVVEVGMGGAYDSTNHIPRPVVCAVTSLGYDHMKVLGFTLSEIAWQKSGIFKPGRPAFTVPQVPEAMDVLMRRASELKASSLQIVPPLSLYPEPYPDLSLRGKHQSYNVSLAVQVCKLWLKEAGSLRSHQFNALSKTSIMGAEPFHLPDLFRQGLKQCVWAGRNQTVKRGNITYYLDGAHTPQSVQASAEWFLSETSSQSDSKNTPLRILMFNITRQRDPITYLTPLMNCPIEYIIFCPNIVSTADDQPADLTNHTIDISSQLSHCYENERVFQKLLKTQPPSTEDIHSPPATKIFSSVTESLQWVNSLSDRLVSTEQGTSTALFVTGSLHLVGTVMAALGFTEDDV